MPSATSRGLAVAAAVLLTAACGSAATDSSAGDSSTTTSAESSGEDASSTEGGEGTATGSNTLEVDGTTVDLDWRPACQRSEDGAKGAIDLLALPDLEEVQKSGEVDGTIAGADFDLDGDEATLTGFRVTNGSQDELIADRFDDLAGNKDDMTITYTEEAVRVEGTAHGTIEGKERTDIPFSIDVGCSTWIGLTDEGDVAPPS